MCCRRWRKNDSSHNTSSLHRTPNHLGVGHDNAEAREMNLGIIKGWALVLSLAGAYCVALECKQWRRKGFGMWVGANILWLISSVATGDTIQCTLWLAYLVIALKGYINNNEVMQK